MFASWSSRSKDKSMREMFTKLYAGVLTSIKRYTWWWAGSGTAIVLIAAAAVFFVWPYMQDEAAGGNEALASDGYNGTFSLIDRATGKTIQYTVSIIKYASSTGGYTPKGMEQYEFRAKFANLSDTEIILAMGPLHIIDDKGKSYEGVVYNGPVYGMAGGMEIVMGEVTGVPNSILTLKPKETVEERLFVAIPENAKPREFTIVLGSNPPNTIHLKAENFGSALGSEILNNPELLQQMMQGAGSQEVEGKNR
jgi:hypothetical protein